MIKNDQKMRKIFKEFNNQNFVGHLQNSENETKHNQIVEYVLENISEDCAEFIRKEYIQFVGKKYWYYTERSKSSYYRDKRKAIDEFIELYNDVSKLNSSTEKDNEIAENEQ